MQHMVNIQQNIHMKNPITEPVLFPQYVLEAIQQTTKLRNDVSHRIQGEIGMFESAQALRGVYLILKWWNNEKSLIDWSATKEDILVCALERNKCY